jgi:hypothetical protein
MDIFKDKEVMARVIAEMIVADIMSTCPADSAEKSPTTTEKMAWIEVYDDVLDEAYDMSQEYREYD